MNAALQASRVSAADSETVFGVLAERARSDSGRRLAAYLLGGTIAAAMIVLMAPRWWPLAGFAAALATFGAWGLLERRGASTTHGVRLLRLALATAGTIAALLFIIGVFLVWFTGDTTSPYGRGERSPRLTGPDTAVQAPSGLFR